MNDGVPGTKSKIDLYVLTNTHKHTRRHTHTHTHTQILLTCIKEVVAFSLGCFLLVCIWQIAALGDPLNVCQHLAKALFYSNTHTHTYTLYIYIYIYIHTQRLSGMLSQMHMLQMECNYRRFCRFLRPQIEPYGSGSCDHQDTVLWWHHHVYPRQYVDNYTDSRAWYVHTSNHTHCNLWQTDSVKWAVLLCILEGPVHTRTHRCVFQFLLSGLSCSSWVEIQLC